MFFSYTTKFAEAGPSDNQALPIDFKRINVAINAMMAYRGTTQWFLSADYADDKAKKPIEEKLIGVAFWSTLDDIFWRMPFTSSTQMTKVRFSACSLKNVLLVIRHVLCVAG